MMDKTASEAYFQGAHEALESMNVPHHIKVAAAEYLTKEALSRRALVGGLGGLGLGGAAAYGYNKLVGGEEVAGPPIPERDVSERIENATTDAMNSARRGMSDLGDYAADLKARAMSGDLSTAEMAALGVTGAGLLGGAAYGASKLM